VTQHLTLVHTAENTEPPQLDGPTEPCVVTGPNDPHSINIQRADYIGGLLKKAHTMVEERTDTEMAAFCATLCPVHDGCVTDGSACTCTDRCTQCQQRFTEADAAADSITDTCSNCLRSA
jgi:hypothetical protein